MSFEVYTHHLKVPFMRCVKLMELTEWKSTVGEIVMGSLHTQWIRRYKLQLNYLCPQLIEMPHVNMNNPFAIIKNMS